MDTIQQTIREALETMEMRFEALGDGFLVRGKSPITNNLIATEVQGTEHAVVAVSHMPAHALPEQRDEVQNFFADLNDRYILGSWDANRSTGAMKFRIAVPLAHQGLTKEMVMDLIISNIMIFDGVMKAALQVAMGALKADQAIEQIAGPKFDAAEIAKKLGF